jgi:hypothetical protein
MFLVVVAVVTKEGPSTSGHVVAGSNNEVKLMTSYIGCYPCTTHMLAEPTHMTMGLVTIHTTCISISK